MHQITDYEPYWILVLAVLGVCFPLSAYGYDLGPVELHGFASFGYLDSSGNNLFADSKGGSFEYNEMGLTANTAIDEDIFVGAQIFSRDYGVLGNNELILNWALLDYHWRDWLGFKVGKILRLLAYTTIL